MEIETRLAEMRALIERELIPIPSDDDFPNYLLALLKNLEWSIEYIEKTKANQKECQLTGYHYV